MVVSTREELKGKSISFGARGHLARMRKHIKQWNNGGGGNNGIVEVEEKPILMKAFGYLIQSTASKLERIPSLVLRS